MYGQSDARRHQPHRVAMAERSPRGRLKITEALAIGVSVHAVQARLSHVWLRHHRFGPMEWILCTIAYDKLPPLRRTQAG